MLDFTRRRNSRGLRLVHHDDDAGRGDAPYDAGAEIALAAASDHDFTVVSVRDDWSSVFVPQGAADTA